MSDLEKAAVKAELKNLVDNILPLVIQAEEARLPIAYAPIAKVLVDATLPALQAAIDARIAAI